MTKEKAVDCKDHNFIVTDWLTKGGIQKATAMRCSHCLKRLSLEELESREFAIKNKLDV